MSPQQPIDIFLSYSRHDEALMRRLYHDLQGAGFTVWIDQTNLTPGTSSWQRAVETAINDARCVVVILSPEAKQSKWVEIEVSIGEDLGLLVIPLLAKGDDRNAVLFRLRTTHRIDIRHDYQAAIQNQLIPTLQAYLQRPRSSKVVIPATPRWWKRSAAVGIFGTVFFIGLVVITQPYWRSFGSIGATPTFTAFPTVSTATALALVVNTPTASATAIPTTAPTNTAVPPTATTAPTATPTDTALPPTLTATLVPTPKPVLPTATLTPIATDTPLPTATNTTLPTVQLSAEEWTRTGRDKFDRKDYQGAIEDYTKAIELDPNYASAYANRAAAYHFQAKYDLTIADATKAIELEPTFAIAYYNRGRGYDEQAKYDLAIENYTKAIELDPTFVAAYYDRGRVYYLQGKYDLAIENHTKAIELNPTFATAYGSRGAAYYQQAKYDLAIADETKAIELDPNYATAYSNRGYAYKQKADKQNAIADYQKAADLYQQQGNTAKQQSLLDQIKQLQQ